MTTPAASIRARQAQLRVLMLVASGMWLVVAARSVTLGRPWTATVQIAGTVVVLATWWLARGPLSERKLQAITHLALTASTGVLIVNSLLNGRPSASPFLLALVPPVAAYVIGLRAGVAWTGVSLASSIAIVVIQQLGLVHPEFQQGPWELILGHYVPINLALLVLAVASRRSSDERVAAAGRSEALARHHAEELAMARDAALEAGRAKTAFLANMSHELRTPLNAVIGMASVIDHTHLSQDQRECITTIRTSGETLLALLSDVLDFTKIEAGKVELDESPVDLSHCLEDAIDLVASAAAEKGLELTYDIGPEVPAWVVTDRSRVQQILLNLLSNAVKFTAAGEVSVDVAARAAADGTHTIEFCVRDDGIGIPADRMGRLFKTFSQVDASTTRQYGGTGLGLAISKALVALLGGEIAVESVPGQGSTFRFTIRARAAEPDAGRRTRPSSDAVRGLRVLLVSGSARIRETVRRQLTTLGATVEAVPMLAEKLAGDWDVAVVDAGARLPALDGARKLRRDRPELPLVLLLPLGRHDPFTVDFVKREVGATISKPVKPARLVGALARSVGRAAAVSSSAPPNGEAEVVSTPRLQVLVAEDNPVNQRVQRRLLEQLGHQVDVVSDGKEALEAVSRKVYDVLFLDLQMPVLDGLETARRLTSREPGARRPRLIALTANASRADREACIAAGMDAYLSKPVRLSDLQGALLAASPATPGEVEGAPGRGAHEERLIDLEVLSRLKALESAANETFLASLVDVFFADAPRRLADIQRAISAGDAQEITLQAHSLKGSAGALGIVQVRTLASEIETKASAGDLASLGAGLSMLREALAIAEPALREAAARAQATPWSPVPP